MEPTQAAAGLAGAPPLGAPASEFYHAMADELTDLARRTAELTWTCDAKAGGQRSHGARATVAPTGRLPPRKETASAAVSAAAAPGGSALHLPPQSSGLPRQGGALPGAARRPSPRPLPAELSTKKPAHLEGARLQAPAGPRAAARRHGPQPGQGGVLRQPRPRQLRLGAPGAPRAYRAAQRPRGGAWQHEGAPPAEACPPGPAEEQPGPNQPSFRSVPATPGAGTPSARSDATVRSKTCSSVPSARRGASSPAARSGGRLLSGALLASRTGTPRAATWESLAQGSAALAPSPAGHRTARTVEAEVSPCSAAAPVQIEAEAVEPQRALLEAVVDLQLVVPGSLPAPAPAAPVAVGPLTGPCLASESALRAPPSRPMLRGLIADVIDEMTAFSCRPPAEVVGGVEITPGISTGGPTRRPERRSSLDEDASGRPVVRPPPPYDADIPGLPPPYDDERLAAHRSTPIATSQWVLSQPSLVQQKVSTREAQLQTSQLEMSTREAQLQTSQLEMSTREAQLQTSQLEVSTREAQLQTSQLEVPLTEAQVQTSQLDASSTHALTGRVGSATGDQGEGSEKERPVEAALRQHAEAVHQQLAAAAQHTASLQTSVATLQAQLADLALRGSRAEAAAVAEGPPPAAAMLEGVRRLELQMVQMMERQGSELRQLLVQSGERAAAATAAAAAAAPAAGGSAPTVHVLPILHVQAPPQPPPAPPDPPAQMAPAVPTLPAAQYEVRRSLAAGTQTSIIEESVWPEGSARPDSLLDAKVSRFTEYLLHGAPGRPHRTDGSFETPVSGMPQPGTTADMLLRMLRPVATSAARSTPSLPHAFTSTEASASLGEVSGSSWEATSGEVPSEGSVSQSASLGQAASLAASSLGEIAGAASSLGEVAGAASSLGEVAGAASSLDEVPGAASSLGEVLGAA
ncbi:unnamed protein product, partial [Prorocentrum cordatum]